DWALPVMVALYTPRPKDPEPEKTAPKDPAARGKTARNPESNAADAGRHKTPPLLARQMLATLIHWFPERRFVLLGDWGFASHDLALFCHRHADRVMLIGRLRSDANLHGLPAKTKRPGPGRRQRKGRKLPSPRRAVEQADRRTRATVRWYGNATREVETLSGCAASYRGRGGGRAALIPIRWVYVHDTVEGREDYFYSTNPTLTPVQIVEAF